MSFSEWHKVRLDKANIDIIDGDRGKNYPKKNEFYSEGHCLFLNAKNVTSEGFSFSETMYIDKEKDNLLRKGKLKRRDIVLTTRGTVGNVAFYGDRIKHENIRINSGMVILRPDITEYDSEYIYWLFRSPMIQEQINSYRTGSAQPQLPIKIMKTLEFNKPPLQEQKAIAQILSTLDEKIEVNNRINKTLEEMAQAIFKHWFVDFEFPNEDGEPYKSSGGEMVHSELGLIPKGWKVGTLQDLGDIVGGGTPSRKKEEYFMSKGIPWITPKDLSNNKNKYIYKGENDISELGLKNSSAKIVPKGTVLFSSRAPIGYIAVAAVDVTTNQGFKSIVPREIYGSEYVYQELRNKTELISNRASGSTFKEISGSGLKSIETVLPSKELVREFNTIVNPLSNKIKANEKEIDALTEIRDTLLPKLMSGEIRVPLDNEE